MKPEKKLKKIIQKEFKDKVIKDIESEEEYEEICETAKKINKKMFMGLELIAKTQSDLKITVFELFENLMMIDRYETKTNKAEESRFFL